MLFFIAIATGLQTLLLEFLQALRGLVTSKKVITAITTTLVAFAARHNYNLDPELVALIFAIGAILIHAQGQTDQGKEAAIINAGATKQTTTQDTSAGGAITQVIKTEPVAPNPLAPPASATDAPKGFAVLELLGAVGLVTLIFVPLYIVAGCGSSLTGKGVGTDALNCAAPSATKAIADYGQTFDTALAGQINGDGSLVKPTIESMLVSLVSDEAKCVGLNSLAKLLTPGKNTSGVASSALVANHDDAATLLSEMKTKLAPGRSITLPAEQAAQ